MPLISLSSRWHVGLDNALRAKAMTFLLKLSENDTIPGLHVEPIANSVDPRVRTGRVDQFWRAVMFRLDGGDEPHYVVHGVWAHDDAIDVARRSRLKVNPVNGVVTIREEEPAPHEPAPVAWPEPPAVEGPVDQDEDRELPPIDSAPPLPEAPPEPLLTSYGYRLDELVDRLGLPHDVAARGHGGDQRGRPPRAGCATRRPGSATSWSSWAPGSRSRRSWRSSSSAGPRPVATRTRTSSRRWSDPPPKPTSLSSATRMS